jgi:superfamily I DNA/RNA helicase
LAKYLQDCVANAPQASSSKDGTVCLFPNWKTLDSYLERLAAQVPCIKRKTNPDPNRLWLERVLYLAITPNQRFVERLLLNEYKQIMPRHKRMLVVRILERDISVVAALQSLIADGSLFGNAAAQSHEACQLLEDLSSRNAARTAQHIATKLGKDLPTTEFHLEGLLEKSDELEKEELLATYCDLILPDSALPAEDPRAILFLTMHGAKGLTKKNIVIPGLEAAWLPGTSTGAELEEKRRLFYVAITRATDSVLITFPQNRSRKDSLNYLTPGRGEPSPFIAEAGLKDVYHS